MRSLVLLLVAVLLTSLCAWPQASTGTFRVPSAIRVVQ